MVGDADQVTLPRARCLPQCPSLPLSLPTLSTANRLHDYNEREGESEECLYHSGGGGQMVGGRGGGRRREGERGRRKSFCREDFDVFTMRRGQSRWSRSPAAATNRKSGREETEMGSFLTNSTERRNGQIYQCTNA